MTADSTINPAPPFMRALRQGSRRGPADLQLVINERVPTPGPGEVLVKVHAAGVNYADVMQTYGTYVGGPSAPYSAGFEMAGKVVALGADAAWPAVGDLVLGTGGGAYAQYATAAVDGLIRVPDGWTAAQAIGLELNWLTALAALRPLGGLSGGQTVLIHAAAGGVGQAAVRLARHYGARVFGSASVEKAEVVRALGVDAFIGYSYLPEQVMGLTEGRGVDLVLDSVGATTLTTSLAVAKPISGRVVVFGTASGDTSVAVSDLIFRYQVSLIGLHIGALAQQAPTMRAELIGELGALVRCGVIGPGNPEIHALDRGRDVLQRLEARDTVGKQVLVPQPASGPSSVTLEPA